VLVITDSDRFYVDASFMETKLPAVRDGDLALVQLMAGNVIIEGRLQGVSRGIAEAGVDAVGQLANINPISPGCASRSACRSASLWARSHQTCA
jgi:multidrug resistance efflux pump